MKMKISNFLKTHFFSIVLKFVDDFTLNSDNNKEVLGYAGLGIGLPTLNERRRVEFIFILAVICVPLWPFWPLWPWMIF
jgi:uncharacterized protein (DUF1499 family)